MAYFGKSQAASFSSTAVTCLRNVDIQVKAADPDIADKTCAADSARTELMGLPGAVRTTIEVQVLDTADGAHMLLDLSVNDSGTFTHYPEGNSTGNETITVASAYFLGPGRTFQIGELTVMTANFRALGEPTYSTVGA